MHSEVRYWIGRRLRAHRAPGSWRDRIHIGGTRIPDSGILIGGQAWRIYRLSVTLVSFSNEETRSLRGVLVSRSLREKESLEEVPGAAGSMYRWNASSQKAAAESPGRRMPVIRARIAAGSGREKIPVGSDGARGPDDAADAGRRHRACSWMRRHTVLGWMRHHAGCG